MLARTSRESTMLKHRSRSVVAAAAAAVALSAAPAFAGPPQPADQTIDVDAGAACTFPVELVLTGKTKTIDLPGGRTIVTAPGQDVTVTNQDNGRSVTLSITGASTSPRGPTATS